MNKHYELIILGQLQPIWLVKLNLLPVVILTAHCTADAGAYPPPLRVSWLNSVNEKMRDKW